MNSRETALFALIDAPTTLIARVNVHLITILRIFYYVMLRNAIVIDFRNERELRDA